MPPYHHRLRPKNADAPTKKQRNTDHNYGLSPHDLTGNFYFGTFGNFYFGTFGNFYFGTFGNFYFGIDNPEREGELTQFSRALKTLDIKGIHANNPAGKGAGGASQPDASGPAGEGTAPARDP